ncbi:MAG: glycoside hydrolase family 3 protein [Lachnospiraceae bacterium]|nr:glycoside hydrolase family 3 protein [Lachnospiraceae bacterium]
MSHQLDLKKYTEIARKTAAEGCVLLKNDNHALPLRAGEKVAVFGRCALHYYKSGLGSGGLVNTRYVVSILDALQACEDITVEEKLLQMYKDWSIENPIDEGHGWGTVPWSQAEMPVTEEMIQAASGADAAIVIIGRTAGEDQDNAEKPGSYLLTDIETEMIEKVTKAFLRTIVLLNVGNIIDMSWVDRYDPAAVMYVWQGGQEGGNGVLDVLTGVVNPCGKLPDTIAYKIADYPSSANFGDAEKNYYQEDIYVGYRYFESCAREAVQYPFGYGLSYTTFQIKTSQVQQKEDQILVSGQVINIGNTAGKEVVQVYVQAPQGKLGKPLRVLAGFAKTETLKAGASTDWQISCAKRDFASYDDSGITGHKSCWLLEAGEYRIYAGTDVRSAAYVGSIRLNDTEVLEQLEEICGPVESFSRMKLMKRPDGTVYMGEEAVPQRTVDPVKRMEEMRCAEIPYTGNQGYKLGDVLDGTISLDTFVAQLSDTDLICLFRGEGMCSPKVTPGTAGAFGGLTESLRSFGIPPICCADGPSGIRMDCGAKATSLPNGTMLGSTFNLELVEELFAMLGKEIRRNKVDTLLGPGINIHRSPLNGRNFEYVSEDPFLTGKMCAAQLNGMEASDVAGTIKHFCANNQEQNRVQVEAVVSERALREIYLKGFEMAVKESTVRSIMTAYNPVNGIWVAGNYDLCSMVLRKDWGYDGMVMTDWWSTANWEGELAEKRNRAPMVLAQNDVYMCCADVLEEMKEDNVLEMLEKGVVKRSDLQRNAKNILRFILKTPALLRELGQTEEEDISFLQEEGELVYPVQNYAVDPQTGKLVLEQELLSGKEICFGLEISEDGIYAMELEATSDLSELAQLPVSLYVDNLYRFTVTYQGMNGGSAIKQKNLGEVKGRNHYVKLVIHMDGLSMTKVTLSLTKETSTSFHDNICCGIDEG